MAYVYHANDEQSGVLDTIYCNTKDVYISVNPNGRLYQEVLDAIIEQGSACFEGDIPADLQAAADAKQAAGASVDGD